jgi:acetolactate synthase-1/2/3 large subunit
MSGGEALVGALAREGVSHVFGVPGAGQYEAVDPFYGRREIRYLSCRSEQPATYLADGYGRVAGRPAAVIVLSGVGLRSAAPGLETAFDSSSPVLVISDHATEDAVPPALAGIVKWGARVTRPAEAPALVRRAVAETGSGRPRPVYLGVSHAVLAARERVAWAAGGASAGDAAHAAAGLPPDAAETHPGAAGTAQADAWADSSAGALERAAELLAGAARPAIVAGTGVARARAAAALCTLAERLQAPVATSVAAKGVFSDRHPLCLGAAHPPYRPLTEYLRSRDVVLLAGTGWPAAALAEGTRTRTVRIDVEPRADAEVTIQADAGWALAQLAARLDRGANGGPAAAPAVAAEVARLRAQREAPSEQLQPQRSLTEALRAALPEDGILVHDMTQLGYYSRGYFPVYQPDSYQIPRGNLGAALPLALGAKLACPRRAVVALCGDGGLLYHVQELVTAVQYGINVVVVVCNDNAYGNVLRAQQEEFGGRVIGTRLRNPDFPTLAAAFGISGQRAADAAALRRMLAAALEADSPALIEVPLGPLQRRY